MHGFSRWELLKGLTHLNRRARRALLKAPEWVVHLYAGGPGRKPFVDLSSGDMAVLELDIRRDSDQDVMKSPAWRVLVWGAMYGKDSHMLGGSPYRILNVLRHRPGVLLLFGDRWIYMDYPICLLRTVHWLIMTLPSSSGKSGFTPSPPQVGR